MVKQTWFVATLAVLMAVSSAHASNITNLWFMPTTGGVSYDLAAGNSSSGIDTPEVSLTINANQSSGHGAITMGLKTDNPDDPILTLHNSIDNDSAFSWLEYIVTVTMNKPFAFTNTPSVSVPSGWTINVTTPTGPVGGFYTGTLDLLGGVPVDPGDTLDFTYKVFFSGSTSYSITESVDVVPEPSTLALASTMGVLGGLLWGALKLTGRRRA